MKAQGLLKGMLDYCLPVPRGEYHALYIEMKKPKSGKVSPEQAFIVEALRAEGNAAEICYGWDEAREVLEDYLALAVSADLFGRA